MIDIIAGIVIAWSIIELIKLVLRWGADMFPNTFVKMFNIVLTCAIVGFIAGTAYGIWEMTLHLK